MKSNLLKYTIIFFSFFISIIISTYTFFSYVPKVDIPDIFPVQKKIKVIHSIPENEKKLEIYNIISPESLKKKENFKSKPNINEEEKKKISLNNDKNYKLQLGSLRDLDKAKKAYKNITRKYKDFFKNESAVIEKINFPDNGVFYRIKSYESFSKKEAIKICKILILDNKKCLVIKNDKK